MQTFLPSRDFVESAVSLDRQRLGKQRVEALQILNTLLGLSSGWQHHPAVKMWRGHEGCLVRYAIIVCGEWRKRGYVDNLIPRFVKMFDTHGIVSDGTPPSWLGDPAFHASHRSNLLRKKPDHYAAFGWTEPHDLPYVWPLPDSTPSVSSVK